MTAPVNVLCECRGTGYVSRYVLGELVQVKCRKCVKDLSGSW
jgi:hypothetical protein